jgi:TRAP-type mannitol/chloroaromatic compound transport system permease small subunit
MTTPLERLADRIDRINVAAGWMASWCCLFVVAAEFAVVVLRYAFGVGSIALQESLLYAMTAMVLLAAGWTLQTGGHVRVDIFYGPAKPRAQAVIDLVGALVFLVPFAAAVVFLSIPYAARSWSILEQSREASGLHFTYLLKALIPLFAVLLGLQGIAQAIRAVLVLTGPPAQPSR